jgi:hypothetical protein
MEKLPARVPTHMSATAKEEIMADKDPDHPMMAEDNEPLPFVTAPRRAEARANLRKRFPEMSDEDFDELSHYETRGEKFEAFIKKLIEKYKWSRSVCQQQVGTGFNDIRDC